jgi:glucosylglycerate synthase
MATADPIPQTASAPEPVTAELLILLAPMPAEQLDAVLASLATAFAPQSLVIATPERLAADSHPSLQIVSAPASQPSVTLTAADFVNAHQLAVEHQARAIVILGPESASLHIDAVRNLANAVLSSATDLAIPYYDVPANAGLVNSAILYPVTRALFASGARFPLAIDLALSSRMVERIASAAQRFAGANLSESLLWPMSEAAVAGFAVHELDVGHRTLPQPINPDINAIFAQVTGALFADVDLKAAFWQRPRRAGVARQSAAQTLPADGAPDIASMLEAFHLAYSNLRDIWSLVLPPNSLLGLKRLSVAALPDFRMPDNLWARIVYDFLLAYRLRTINRGHLLGALIPLYLAWVASHFNITASGADPERHIESVAAAFEAEKPYLVSRWRWPDRFNP